MGLLQRIFGERREPKDVKLPAILKPENPVNYNSVLDWLLGLSDKDYKTMLDIVDAYRATRKTELKLLKLKDEPTTPLLVPQQTDEEIDNDLDELLDTHPDDLKNALENEES